MVAQHAQWLWTSRLWGLQPCLAMPHAWELTRQGHHATESAPVIPDLQSSQHEETA